MIGIISSEWLRTKRTPIRWLTFCMPVLFSLCAAVYLCTNSEATQEFAFEGFFTIWTVFIIPLGVGVLAGFLIHEEELAGNFNGFLGTGISRFKLYLGKFMLLLFCLTICTLIAALFLCICMNAAMPAGANMWVFLGAAVLVVVGTLPLIAIHLWISFAWGTGASVGCSFGGLLLAALLGLTGLGSHMWQFVPWTLPVKLGMLPGTCFLEKTGTLTAAKLLSQTRLTASIALISVVICLIVFLIGGSIWFNIWEGRKSYE